MAQYSNPNSVGPRGDGNYELIDIDMKQKSQVQVSSLEKSADSDSEVNWRPGVKSQFPWLGIGALLTMLLCGVLTAIILATSNGKAAQEWPVYQSFDWIKESWRQKAELTPSTALALVNTVTNLALAIAIGNGVAIAWWRKALRGATVQELHRSWAYSTSTLELASAGRNFNLIALCALTAKLALIDNVLLQRAASTTTGTFSKNITNLRLPIVKELPAKFAGVWSADGSTGYLTDPFSSNLYNYFSSSQRVTFDELWDTATMEGQFDTGCRGTCDFVVQGFGINVTCSDELSTTYEVTAQSVTSANDFANMTEETFSQNVATSTLMDTFYIAHTAGENYTDPWVEFIVEYATTTTNETFTNADGSTASSRAQTCQGELKKRNCAIRPAVVDYHISVTNVSGSPSNGLQLDQTYGFNYLSALPDQDIGVVKNGQVWTTEVVSAAYQTDSSNFNDVMYSLWNVLYTSFRTGVTLSYLNGSGFAAQSTSGFVGQWWAQSQSNNQFPASCIIEVADPTAWLVTQLNSILLRASISAAVNQNITSPEYKHALKESLVQNISGLQTVDTVRFVSDWPYMGAALCIMFICTMCVLPTYWGFWELGRKVTLGPVEIASAFQAPALASSAVAAGAEVDQMLKEVGQREVRYGIVGDGKLGMAKANEAIELRRGVPIKTAGDL